MNFIFIRILLYAIAFGGVLAYLYIRRKRSSGKFLQDFKENLHELGALVNLLPNLGFDEKLMMIQVFWDAYWVFDGIILQAYIEESGVVTSPTAGSWEERCLDLYQMFLDQKISQQQLDMLLDMKTFVFSLETAQWPGVPYDEQEFVETCMKKIPFYYEMMDELVTTIEESRRNS